MRDNLAADKLLQEFVPQGVGKGDYQREFAAWKAAKEMEDGRSKMGEPAKE